MYIYNMYKYIYKYINACNTYIYTYIIWEEKRVKGKLIDKTFTNRDMMYIHVYIPSLRQKIY